MREIAVSLLGMLAAAGTAAASTLGVAPIRVELNSAVRTAVVTVQNQEDAPVVMQARPAAWSQQDEQDQLADTHDLLVTPPLFTLPPKGKQTLRVALLRAPDPSQELDYRLVLSEVPPEAAPEGKVLRVALRITLPVFAAAQAHAAPDLAWQHSWLPDGTLQIRAQNQGNAHIQVLSFDVQSAEGASAALHNETARYLLSGATARWQLPDGGMSRADRIIIRGHSDAGDFTVTSGPGAK